MIMIFRSSFLVGYVKFFWKNGLKKDVIFVQPVRLGKAFSYALPTENLEQKSGFAAFEAQLSQWKFLSRWWFQTCFIFYPGPWGNDPI